MNSSINTALEKRHHCHSCITQKYCLSRDLNSVELNEFESLTRHRRTLRKGERLFRQGDKFQSLFVVQSGSVKAYVISGDGEQQISGFHFPGELLGVDGVEFGWQTYNAEALETSSVCELSFFEFDQLTERFDVLRHQFFKTLGEQLAKEKRRMLVLGRLHADQRLASFILDIVQRYRQRHFNTDSVSFSMTRNDIANYLGLAVETVSRLLSRFDSLEVIRVRHRTLDILQPAKLLAIATGTEISSQSRTKSSTVCGKVA